MRAYSDLHPITPSLLKTEHIQRQIVCPKCNKRMHLHPNAGAGNIVVNNCSSCGGNWLNYKELHKIIHSTERRRNDERWAAWDIHLEGDIPDIGN